MIVPRKRGHSDMEFEQISWKRTLVFTLILLSVTSLIATTYAQRYEDAYHGWCQLPTGSTKGTLEWYLYKHMSTANSIAFIGDSRMNSYYLLSKQDSLLCHYQELAGESAQIISLALDGSRLGDEYLFTKLATQEGRSAVMSIGYNQFLPKEGAAEIQYHEITTLKGITENDLELSGLAIQKHQGFESTMGGILQLWPIYRYRSEFQTALFNGHPKKYLKAKFMDALCKLRGKKCKGGEKLYLSFVELSADEQEYIIESQKDDYERAHAYNIAASPPYQYIAKLADYVNATHATLLVYAPPLNWALLNETKLLSYEEYAYDMAILRALFEARGVTFIDYNQPIRYHSWQFHDFSHLTNEGTKGFVQELYNDTQGLIYDGRKSKQ